MEFGVHLPSAGPGASAAGILEVARGVEDLGFDAVWLFDHLFTPTDLETKYPYSGDGGYALSAADPFFDPLALIGVISAATSKVKIATGVMIAAYRSPIVLGKALATIENFAPGRLVMGLGPGWMREEFDALGIPFERRGARFTEYLKALRAIWSGEACAFEGEFYRWEEAGFLPAPTAPIPLIVGGHSDGALKRAARHGDGWAGITRKGQGSGLAGLEARLRFLDGSLEEAGRSRAGFEVTYQSALWFSDTPNDKLPLTGPPEVIAESLKRLDELGVTMVDLAVFGPPSLIVETAGRFAAEVKPLL
jgi:probable F420-dependent oxidoreductase